MSYFLQRNSFLFILFWITCHRHKEGNGCVLLKKDTNMDRNNFKLRIDRMEDPKDANEPSFYPTSDQKKQEMTQAPPVLRAKNGRIRKGMWTPIRVQRSSAVVFREKTEWGGGVGRDRTSSSVSNLPRTHGEIKEGGKTRRVLSRARREGCLAAC